METWVFFVIVWLNSLTPAEKPVFGITAYGPMPSLERCLYTQGTVNTKRGEVLMDITPCMRLPRTSKS